MRTFRLLITLIPLAFALGCSAKHEDNSAENSQILSSKAENSKTENSKPEGVLTSAQKQTLEKAHQVDGLLQEANDKRMKELDK